MQPTPFLPDFSPLELVDFKALDANVLANFERQVFYGDRISKRSFQQLKKSPSAWGFGLKDGPALAAYTLFLTRKNSKKGRLYSIAVLPDYAGRGLGKKLLEVSELQASKKNLTELYLEVRKDNDAAIHLYLKLGFKRVGERENYYEDGQSALRMSKRLFQEN